MLTSAKSLCVSACVRVRVCGHQRLRGTSSTVWAPSSNAETRKIPRRARPPSSATYFRKLLFLSAARRACPWQLRAVSKVSRYSPYLHFSSLHFQINSFRLQSAGVAQRDAQRISCTSMQWGGWDIEGKYKCKPNKSHKRKHAENKHTRRIYRVLRTWDKCFSVLPSIFKNLLLSFHALGMYLDLCIYPQQINIWTSAFIHSKYLPKSVCYSPCMRAGSSGRQLEQIFTCSKVWLLSSSGAKQLVAPKTKPHMDVDGLCLVAGISSSSARCRCKCLLEFWSSSPPKWTLESPAWNLSALRLGRGGGLGGQGNAVVWLMLNVPLSFLIACLVKSVVPTKRRWTALNCSGREPRPRKNSKWFYD